MFCSRLLVIPDFFFDTRDNYIPTIRLWWRLAGKLDGEEGSILNRLAVWRVIHVYELNCACLKVGINFKVGWYLKKISIYTGMYIQYEGTFVVLSCQYNTETLEIKQ